MRDLDPASTTEKNAAVNKPLFLYTIHAYDGAQNLYFTEHSEDVTYDGITYSKFPIKHEFITENTQNQIDSVTLSIANVSRLIEAYLVNYDLRGKRVDIVQVWADKLDDTDANIPSSYYIDTYTATEETVTFTLTGKFDLLDVPLPGRTCLRNYCSWRFKSSECGYAGAETLCNKTLQKCRELSNQLRFGGFPSVPTNKIYAG